MQATSHFIGISLNVKILADIFLTISDFVNTHHLQKSIEIQNPLSPHISLYYLGKDLDANSIQDIKNTFFDLRLDAPIFADDIAYFMRNDEPYILYLKPKTPLDLARYRDTFELLFQASEIEDNFLDFIPHTTLVRILDAATFQKHKRALELVIHNEIKTIRKKDISLGSIALYRVNSRFSPQMQVVL